MHTGKLSFFKFNYHGECTCKALSFLRKDKPDARNWIPWTISTVSASKEAKVKPKEYN